MSLSKKQKLISIIDQKKRQSFEERFCDDLCEEILQYLPLKDKIRFECVSKQFQRTVFVKGLEISESDSRYWLKEPPNHWRQITKDMGIKFNLGFDFKQLEQILKKCPNFGSINLSEGIYEEYNRVFELIIKNCHKLSQIKCYLRPLSDQTLKQFIEKFGSKLKCLSLTVFTEELSPKIVDSINSFANIKELELNIFGKSSDVFSLRFKRLKKLTINWKTEELIGLSSLLTINENIEFLHIEVKTKDEIQLNAMFDRISRLHNLIEFKIRSNIRYNEKQIEKYIKQLSQNCPKLKSIGIAISLTEELLPIRDLSQLLSPFKEFKELKRLALRLGAIESYKSFSFKHFKGFENITHLSISAFSWRRISILRDITLEGLDIYLPKLQYLEILGLSAVTKRSAIILSSLRDLKTIKLNARKNVKELIRNKLLENCKRLESIVLTIDF